MACVSFGTYELVHAWLAHLDVPAATSVPQSALVACSTALETASEL
jgi:hypothetical protein